MGDQKKTWFRILDKMVVPLVKSHRGKLAKAIGLTARYVWLKFENGGDYNLHTNGELALIKTLSRVGACEAPILDVGANRGEWALLVNRMIGSQVPIHCFEIVPDTFQRLQDQTATFDHIHVHNIGLSDAVEQIEFHFHPQHSGQSTHYKPMFFDGETHKQQLPVTTGDEFMATHEISHISLLKIDVEGMEHKVLGGFEQAFRDKKIDLVQFEYGLLNIRSKFLLADFFEFFESRGYRVGKMYPHHVEFRDYSMYQEDFIGPNYVAVNSDKANLIEQMGA